MKRFFLYCLFVPALACLTACKANADNDPHFFGVYTATLDGRNVQRILSSPTQQMTHVRPSPDGQWLTLTRYNQTGMGGLAEEEGGYLNTEIMVARADGSDLHTVIPPKKGVIAANSNWSADGKSLIYISTDTPDHMPHMSASIVHMLKEVLGQMGAFSPEEEQAWTNVLAALVANMSKAQREVEMKKIAEEMAI